jgi:hypothetical protein
MWDTFVTVLLQPQISRPQACVYCLQRCCVPESKLFKCDMNPHIKIPFPQVIIWDLISSRHASRKDNFFPCTQWSHKILLSVTLSGQALICTPVPVGWCQKIQFVCWVTYMYSAPSTCKHLNAAPLGCDFLTCKPGTLLVHKNFIMMCSHTNQDPL